MGQMFELLKNGALNESIAAGSDRGAVLTKTVFAMWKKKCKSSPIASSKRSMIISSTRNPRS